MSLIINGTNLENLIINGVTVDKGYVNGTEVFSKSNIGLLSAVTDGGGGYGLNSGSYTYINKSIPNSGDLYINAIITGGISGGTQNELVTPSVDALVSIPYTAGLRVAWENGNGASTTPTAYWRPLYSSIYSSYTYSITSFKGFTTAGATSLISLDVSGNIAPIPCAVGDLIVVVWGQAGIDPINIYGGAGTWLLANSRQEDIFQAPSQHKVWYKISEDTTTGSISIPNAGYFGAVLMVFKPIV